MVVSLKLSFRTPVSHNILHFFLTTEPRPDAHWHITGTPQHSSLWLEPQSALRSRDAMLMHSAQDHTNKPQIKLELILAASGGVKIASRRPHWSKCELLFRGFI